jgi:triosephosphate isomerase
MESNLPPYRWIPRGQEGQSQRAVRAQMEVLLRVYQQTGGPFLIASEPAWAISIGNDPRECTADESQDRHGFLRAVIAAELGGAAAADTTLLHGGSITADNADMYFRQADIDGGLVGGASQQRTSFQALIQPCSCTYRRLRDEQAGHLLSRDTRETVTAGKENQ